MVRKLVGAALLLFILSIVVLIARDNLSLDDWRGHSSSPGDPEAEG